MADTPATTAWRADLAELHALDDLHDFFQVHVTADDEQGRFDAPDVTQRVQEALQSVGSGVHLDVTLWDASVSTQAAGS